MTIYRISRIYTWLGEGQFYLSGKIIHRSLSDVTQIIKWTGSEQTPKHTDNILGSGWTKLIGLDWDYARCVGQTSQLFGNGFYLSGRATITPYTEEKKTQRVAAKISASGQETNDQDQSYTRPIPRRLKDLLYVDRSHHELCVHSIWVNREKRRPPGQQRWQYRDELAPLRINIGRVGVH